jgi:thiol-disulfide isomerase/thioredoxin
MSAPPPGTKRRPGPVIATLALALAVAAAGAALFLGTGDPAPPAAVAEACRASVPATLRIAPLARGEVAALAVSKSPVVPPEIAFRGPAGEDLTLAAFKGKAVLLNLWATWCLPCRQEMPALDKVQAELGGASFEVVAINVDTRDPDKPKAWLQENGIRNLAYYSDSGGKLLQVLQRSGHVVGLPTTLLVDAAGCEIAILKGPTDWASADATRLLRTALAP